MSGGHSQLQRQYRVIQGYIGMMEKKMETTRMGFDRFKASLRLRV